MFLYPRLLRIQEAGAFPSDTTTHCLLVQFSSVKVCANKTVAFRGKEIFQGFPGATWLQGQGGRGVGGASATLEAF
jgi:hypothetical protein